jgi:hypothetical protein
VNVKPSIVSSVRAGGWYMYNNKRSGNGSGVLIECYLPWTTMTWRWTIATARVPLFIMMLAVKDTKVEGYI